MSKLIRPIFGLELEMSYTVIMDDTGQGSVERVWAESLVHAASSRLSTLPSRHGSGLFLANGGRLYNDCGKPEITTPEVTTPGDACRYTRASEQILLELGSIVTRIHPFVRQVIFSRSNVCYSLGTTWACHESYGHQIDHAQFHKEFLPHAVSRIIYTGAGGFDNTSDGAQFMISPRVAHLITSVSGDTQRERGIFNTKEEPLSCLPHRRLHVICGEHVSSLRALWLKMATTSVVLAMIQRGMKPAKGCHLRHPVKAMREFSFDPTLKATAAVSGRNRLTALEIQRRLLDRAKDLDHFDGPWLPDCLSLWQNTLDRLERGPAAVQRTFDWAIKLDLYKHFIESRGMTWEEWLRWDHLLRQAHDEIGRSRETAACHLRSRMRQEAALRSRKVAALLKQENLRREDLDRYFDLRCQVFELDTRFGQLGSEGIFNSLDHAGHLDHGAPGADRVNLARTEPPSDTRATVRGAIVREFSSGDGHVTVDWHQATDAKRRRSIDLSNPFCLDKHWAECPEQDASPTVSVRRRVRMQTMFGRGRSSYAHGHYRQAIDSYQPVEQIVRDSLSDRRALATLILCRARIGQSQAREQLVDLHAHDLLSAESIQDHIVTLRFLGLVAPEDLNLWLNRWRNSEVPLLTQLPQSGSLLASSAYQQMCDGQVDAAVEEYERALSELRTDRRSSLEYCRVSAELAEAFRRVGNYDRSESLLNSTAGLQSIGEFFGDRSEFTRVAQARLLVDRGQVDRALEVLQATRRELRVEDHPAALVRIALLIARLSSTARHASDDVDPDQLKRYVETVVPRCSAILQCPRYRQIMDQWSNWCSGAQPDFHTDFFCGI